MIPLHYICDYDGKFTWEYLSKRSSSFHIWLEVWWHIVLSVGGVFILFSVNEHIFLTDSILKPCNQ
jgi:hypothetical protein